MGTDDVVSLTLGIPQLSDETPPHFYVATLDGPLANGSVVPGALCQRCNQPPGAEIHLEPVPDDVCNCCG